MFNLVSAFTRMDKTQPLLEPSHIGQDAQAAHVKKFNQNKVYYFIMYLCGLERRLFGSRSRPESVCLGPLIYRDELLLSAAQLHSQPSAVGQIGQTRATRQKGQCIITWSTRGNGKP